MKSRVQEKLAAQELTFKQQGDRAMEKEYAQIYGIVMESSRQDGQILGEETVASRISGSFWRPVLTRPRLR